MLIDGDNRWKILWKAWGHPKSNDNLTVSPDGWEKHDDRFHNEETQARQQKSLMKMNLISASPTTAKQLQTLTKRSIKQWETVTPHPIVTPGSQAGPSKNTSNPVYSIAKRRGFAKDKHNFEQWRDHHIPHDQPMDRRPQRYQKGTHGEKTQRWLSRSKSLPIQRRSQSSKIKPQFWIQGSFRYVILDSCANPTHLRRKHYGMRKTEDSSSNKCSQWRTN